MTVNKKLVKARIDKGWNQKELAIRAGVAPSGISEYERHDRIPRVRSQWKIAEALGLQPLDLWDDYMPYAPSKPANEVWATKKKVDQQSQNEEVKEDKELAIPIPLTKRPVTHAPQFTVQCNQCGKKFRIYYSDLKKLVNCPFCNNGRTFTHMYGWE